MTESQEFNAWLRRNYRYLQGRAPDEIAYLARLNGFSLAVICPKMCDQASTFKRKLDFEDSPFRDLWIDLRCHEYGNKRGI